MISRYSRGITLVTVLIAFTLVALAAFLLSQVFTGHSRGTARLDRGVRGDQVLTTTAAAIQQMDFEAIVGVCTTRSAFSGPVTGSCTAGGKLNPAAVPATGTVTDATTLDVRRGWDGEVNAGGPVCVELTECKRRANGHLVELTFKGYWADSSDDLPLQSRIITLRRTRW